MSRAGPERDRCGTRGARREIGRRDGQDARSASEQATANVQTVATATEELSVHLAVEQQTAEQ